MKDKDDINIRNLTISIIILFIIAIWLIVYTVIKQNDYEDMQNSYENCITVDSLDVWIAKTDSLQTVIYDSEFIIMKQARDLQMADKAVMEIIYASDEELYMLRKKYK